MNKETVDKFGHLLRMSEKRWSETKECRQDSVQIKKCEQRGYLVNDCRRSIISTILIISGRKCNVNLKKFYVIKNITILIKSFVSVNNSDHESIID